MTKQEFIELVDGAPYDFERVAEFMSDVTDDDELAEVGEAFKEALQALEDKLDELEIELG